MNLIEAIKSGKDFKRKDHGDVSRRPMIWISSEHTAYNFTKEDILATDWIVKEEKKTIMFYECVVTDYDKASVLEWCCQLQIDDYRISNTVIITGETREVVLEVPE